MTTTVHPQTFEGLVASWQDLSHLRWSSPFVLPLWLKTWWEELGSGAGLFLREIREDGSTIGVAALRISGGTASFVGSADVCDYMDFAVAPGREQAFHAALLDDLGREGVAELHLEALRGDSTVITHLVEIARSRGHAVSVDRENVSLDLALPVTWEEYLGTLNPKQRHEVRRRLRRLDEAGEVRYRVIGGSESVEAVMDVFLGLLRGSREDKAAFMTGRMERFFRSMAAVMAGADLLTFGVLEIDGAAVAVVMCFDYNEGVYLYNSGYDTDYGSLSVGLMSKVLSIKDSIERGRKLYDFLKGAEDYKYRLAGTEIPIFGCRIALK